MGSNHERYTGSTRREFLKTVGGGAAGALVAGPAYAHHHGKPMPQSLPYLDQRMYLHNMEIVAHLPSSTRAPAGFPGRSVGQIMSIGRRRFILSSGDMIDITDPRKPEVVNDGAATGNELAYNSKLKKWILLQDVSAPNILTTTPFGKYEIPNPTRGFRDFKGFRGIRLYDATNPQKIDLLSEFNTGSTGAGGHGDQTWYDGGKYAYVGTTADDSFTGILSCMWMLSSHLMIVDVSDPASPKKVSMWWVPGQRNDEVAALKKWACVNGRGNDLPTRTMGLEESIAAFKQIVPRFPAPDRMPFSCLHGPVIVPERVEEGGRIGYGSWSSLGFLIHDMSDVTKPKVVGEFNPAPTFWNEGIPCHTIWLGTLPRGFVVTISESLNPDCNEEWLPCFVTDVRDPAHPVPIAQLPRPQAPSGAPFTDFCFRRGRFSSHKPTDLKMPGRISQTFLPIESFNAGVRCYDLSEPTHPKEVAWFVPPMGGTLSPECRVPSETLKDDLQKRCIEESGSFVRPCNGVSIEWDRNIIYAGTTTGMYVLTSPALGRPRFDAMAVTQWSLPHVNLGAPGSL